MIENAHDVLTFFKAFRIENRYRTKRISTGVSGKTTFKPTILGHLGQKKIL